MSIPAIHVRDLTGGWNPSVDAYNAPGNILVRADNLTWEQENVPRLRSGSVKINATALGDAIKGLFTTTLAGQRIRMSAAGERVYANGSLLASGFTGTTDVAFGSHMDQILIARDVKKVKWDGATVRNWGIAIPTVAATLTEDPGNSIVIAACNNGSFATVDAATEGAVSNVTGYDGGQAQRITVNATTFRGSMQTAFAAKDLTDFSGEAGSDTDLIEFYIKVGGSQFLTSLALQFDVNAASAAPFQDDYFQTILNITQGVEVKLAPEEAVVPTDIELFERQRIRAEFRSESGVQTGEGLGSTSRIGRAASWVRFSIPRGRMERVGSTSGKGWDTVVGVRLVAQFTAVGCFVDLDNVTITGGEDHALTGKFQIRYVYVYNAGTYQGKSGVSPTSELLDVRAGAVVATIPPSPDSQVNETWVYIQGGGLGNFYRGAVLTTNGGVANIGQSEVTLAILNVIPENNSPPPDDIIAIVGPHHSRTWVLTPTMLYPSRRNNPDSFDLTQGIRIGSLTENAYWLVLTTEGNLFVGTNKQIHRIGGRGLEYPDGTTDFTKDPVEVEPPIDYGVAVDGQTIYYIGSDGWRMFNGSSSTRIVGVLDELYKGFERYGVKAVNLGTGHARFRCAVFNGNLFALSGEGIAGNDEYSPALHVFCDKGIRERRTYPFNIVTLYREPDGGLLAGCTDGFIRKLEVNGDDDGALINYVMWDPIRDGGTPLNYKDPFGLEIHADTGNAEATVALHVDSSETAAMTFTFASGSPYAIARRIDTLTPFRAIQMRITGSSDRFLLREYSFNYRLRPQRRLYVDTGYIDTGRNFSVWARRAVIKARIKAQLTCLVYFDDNAFTAFTTVAGAPIDKVTHFKIPFPKNFKGRQIRVVVYATNNSSNLPAAAGRIRIDEFSMLPTGVADLDALERMRFATVGYAVAPTVAPETDNSFECYWIELDFAPTGNENEASIKRVPIG